MSNLRHAGNFRELLVYQKARELQREIFQLTLGFPKDEKFSLTDQIRRSSRSIGANIAEAWGKRRYENHFVSKLTDADGENYETQHWIETAVDCKYSDSQRASALIERYKEVGRLLSGMMDKANLFCGEPPRALLESAAEYLVDSPNNETD